ncbi:tryptophan--tRNA ligase [Paenibacillus flagellatus]|uniref:Tryptophan--tRNA ligase n=1 Tax=Paenibacillus flagellatus TaxID=2211139 RepID=A0A2V5KXW8_9BACL|nr:tryptophan--tRNA ligase [Paenibacillus flagellatus]PYI57397.1 tryptophan--tRNA ligase [Paenibacillus flagellatus]
MIRTGLVSGIRPTGELHIGNYYGALKGLVELQERYDARYFIADVHSLTTHPKPDGLRGLVVETARNYLAAGLDPERCTLYAQSSVAAEVCELHAYLSMVMPLGELLRVPTFKDKAKRHPDNVNYGLVGYPVLMAADIFLVRTELVMVGEDQLVHLEVARAIARRFNQLYGDLLPEPQPLVGNAARIPSLSGQGKMSKSDDPAACIGLGDDERTVEEKTRRALSDPLRAYRHQPGHPTEDGCNVFRLHTFFTGEAEREEIAASCCEARIGCIDCKKRLAERLSGIVEPFRRRKGSIGEADALDALRLGRDKAKEAAGRTIADVRRAIGLQML